jgi:hypothetical protein
MVTGREHRMTEVLARLAPGAAIEAARAELRTRYAAILAAHPEVYKPADHYEIGVTRIHDQINSVPTRFCGCCLLPQGYCL